MEVVQLSLKKTEGCRVVCEDIETYLCFCGLGCETSLGELDAICFLAVALPGRHCSMSLPTKA